MWIIRVILFLAFISWTLNAVSQEDDSSSVNLDEKLMIAADQGDTVTALQLIRKGANVNAATIEGVTPLMYASQNGHTAMVKLLLRSGADASRKPANGFTALISAIRTGHIETAEYLIRNGTDVNLPDDQGVTPLMHAIAVDSFYLPDMLLYYNARVESRTQQGIDALMLASWLGRYEIAISLLTAGSDINASDDRKWTPLHYATAAGYIDMMELLIVNGAYLESVNASGYTPLSVAVARSNYKAARMLIGYGADVNSRISSSLNPLTLALENKQDSLVDMLENHGARQILRPYFNHFTLGSHWQFNADDAQMGFTIGMSDSKYNLMTYVGYSFRMNALQVLEKNDESTFYQYWEKRHFISWSIEKALYMPPLVDGLRMGLFGGFSGVLTFGSYRGSTENPDVRLLFNPRFGMILDYRFIRLKANYEYLDLHLSEMDEGWFNISVEFLFRKSRGNHRPPSINWL